MKALGVQAKNSCSWAPHLLLSSRVDAVRPVSSPRILWSVIFLGAQL